MSTTYFDKPGEFLIQSVGEFTPVEVSGYSTSSYVLMHRDNFAKLIHIMSRGYPGLDFVGMMPGSRMIKNSGVAFLSVAPRDIDLIHGVRFKINEDHVLVGLTDTARFNLNNQGIYLSTSQLCDTLRYFITGERLSYVGRVTVG